MEKNDFEKEKEQEQLFDDFDAELRVEEPAAEDGDGKRNDNKPNNKRNKNEKKNSKRYVKYH